MLSLHFKALDIETIRRITGWVYDDTGEGISMKAYHDAYLKNPDKLTGPGGCEGYAVSLGQELFGLFEYSFREGLLEIGCALAPAFKGKGHGVDFVTAGIDFGCASYAYTGQQVVLTVDVANGAARRVYEKAGFYVEKQDEATLWMSKDL